MKNTISLLFFLLCFGFSFSQVATGTIFKHDSSLLENACGQPTNIKNETKTNGVIVVFSCNTCPFVVGSPNFPGWEEQYEGLKDLAEQNEIGLVLINSNEAKRDGVDSFEEMKKHAKNKGYSMPYLLDKNAGLANLLKAKTTPHIYFFDGASRLIYTGSIDNIWDGKRKKDVPYLKNAIDNHVNHKKIKPSETPAKGCSIKRIKNKTTN